jgi:hypothetical protein
MNNITKYLIYIFLLLVLIILIIYFTKSKEQFTLNTLYTQSSPTQQLRDTSHLPPTVYRVTNTILTSAGTFSDKMDSLTLPDNVKDSFNEWIEKGLVSPVKDQMLCGGCWAFATCGSLADRISIATGGKWYSPFGLSEQVLISCGGDMGMDFYQGCDGGIPAFAIEALSKDGVPMDSKCVNCAGGASSGGGGTNRGGGVVNPNDNNTCSSGGNSYASTDYTWWQTGCDGTTSCNLTSASTCPCDLITSTMNSIEPSAVRYKTIGQAHTYTAHGENDEQKTVDLWPDIPQNIINDNVLRMKKAIYYEGPLTVGYRVTADFYRYWPSSGVDTYYKYDGTSQMAGGHAVVIVGWKKMSDGTPVWIIKNSWGVNGGYGFPNGPKWKHPVTGKETIKYMGGFWNHIMGINDSFIESNASGAHPDLSNSILKPMLPNVPSDWYKTMTLRDLYKGHHKDPKPKPTPSPEPNPIPGPMIITPVFKTDKFNSVVMTPVNITRQSIEEFFEKGGLYILGANTPEILESAIKFLPASGKVNEEDMNKLVFDFASNVKGYLVLAVKGNMNYYYMSGDPENWTVFNKTYIHRAATLRKLSYSVYMRIQSLNLNAPVVELSAQ